MTAFGHDASGRVLVAYTGWFSRRTRVSRYDRRGRIDRAFGNDGRAPLPPHRGDWTGTEIGTIEVDRLGRIALGGSELTDEQTRLDYVPVPLIARLQG